MAKCFVSSQSEHGGRAPLNGLSRNGWNVLGRTFQSVMSARCPVGLGPVFALRDPSPGPILSLVPVPYVGYERDSDAVIVGAIGFTTEYFVSNGAASFCLFITPSPTRQPIGLFLRNPAAAFVIRLTQLRRLPADTL